MGEDKPKTEVLSNSTLLNVDDNHEEQFLAINDAFEGKKISESSNQSNDNPVKESNDEKSTVDNKE